jgi:hypothetical protein
MKNVFMSCPECDGHGYVTIDLNDTHVPYEQNPVDFTCMSCDGCGYVPDKDEIPFRIEEVNELIDGMQTRMRVISDTIMYCKKGLLHELAEKYVYRLDTCARGIGRLINYKKKLFPFIIALFFLDRAVLVFVWSIPSIRFKKWLFNELEMRKSLIRVSVGLIVVLILALIGC